MKAKFAAVALILVLAGAVAWQLAPRAETPRAEPSRAALEPPSAEASVCRLTGRVTDGAGPVAGARVEIAAVETVTDAQGAFALETPREGPDVLAASSGALRAQQAIELRHGDLSAGTLVLWDCVAATGVVLDPGGEGASGAIVEAWPAALEAFGDNPLAWTKPPPPISASTLSGEGGAFRLPLPRGAAMVLRARKGDTMSREEVGYDLHDDTGLLVLRLVAPGAIRGRVVDLAGTPVAGASVHLVPPPRSFQFPQPDVLSVRGIRATTGADGEFVLPALPEVYGVLVTHGAFAPFHDARVLAPRDGWTIRLSPGRALEGVVEADGRPAPGVEVRFVPTDGHAAPQEARTDEAGKFAFAHAAIDRPFHLLADGGRLGTALLRDVEWNGEPVRIALDPVSDVLGRVVLEDGTPVAGVRLAAFEFIVQTGTTAFLRGYRETTSRPDGRFLLEGASRCHAVGLYPGEPWMLFGSNRIPADGSEVVLKVAPFRRLKVHVVDGEGLPVAGAAILGSAFTDAEGSCEVLASAWMTELVATKPGWRGSGAVSKDTDAVSIVLAPSPALRGIVRDKAGAPLADVRVQSTFMRRLSATSTGGGLNGTTFTDASGAFVLDIADEAAEASLTLERAGFLSLGTAGRVGTEVKEYVLEPATAIAGRVVDEQGEPIAGAMVSAGAWRRTWTAADGRFVLDDVTPGDHLSLYAAGYARQQMVRTDPRAQGEQAFVLPRELVITGQVLMGDGTPAYPVTVSALAETPPAPYLGTMTDAEGRFRIAGLSAGRYKLHVEPLQHVEGKDFDTAEWEPLVGVAAGTTGVVFRQKAPQVLAGIVADENDRGLRGARVNLFDANGEFVKGDYVDDNGRFRIPVRSGKYELRVNRAGMAFKRQRGIASGREDIVLRFESGREITGQIGSPDGYAPESGSVEVSSAEVHGYAELDRSGAFAIRGLPAGTYELAASGAARSGGPAMRGTAQAAAGAIGVRIELKKIELR